MNKELMTRLCQNCEDYLNHGSDGETKHIILFDVYTPLTLGERPPERAADIRVNGVAVLKETEYAVDDIFPEDVDNKLCERLLHSVFKSGILSATKTSEEMRSE